MVQLTTEQRVFGAQNKDPYRRATYVGSFEVSVLAHVALPMLAAIFLASQ
jgi:hypothetical protein